MGNCTTKSTNIFDDFHCEFIFPDSPTMEREVDDFLEKLSEISADNLLKEEEKKELKDLRERLNRLYYNG